LLFTYLKRITGRVYGLARFLCTTFIVLRYGFTKKED